MKGMLKINWLLLVLAVFLAGCSTTTNDPIEEDVISFVVTMQMPTSSAGQAVEIPVAPPADTANNEFELANLLPQQETEPAAVPADQSALIVPLPSATSAPAEQQPLMPLPTETAMPIAETPIPPTPTSIAYYQPVVVNPKPSGAGWQSLPIIPEGLSQTAKDIYWYGINQLGRNGKFFSKIGDCQSMANVFMGEFDYNTDKLEAEGAYLEDAVYHYMGAFSSISYAVANGMSAASVLTTTWSDPSVCNYGESALLCEIRVHSPSVVFVNLGTNWITGTDPDVYFNYMDEIVYTIIRNGALPIVTSKADNVEGNHIANEINAAIAQKYDVPFFNFWRAVQPLENHGLDPMRSNIYLTVDAWDVWSLWGLRMLYSVGHSLALF